MEILDNYVYQGEAFQVYLTRKRMKNIRYRLRDNAFYISAPYLASKASILRSLNKFAPMLIEKRKPEAKGDNFIYLYGDKYPINNSGSLTLNNGRNINYSSQVDLEKKLRKLFLSVVTQRVRVYENKMRLASHNVRVRSMRSRYGSNSRRTNTVCFATSLMHYSIDILDAIVVHELAHSVHFDHSPKFYAVVYQYLPNYDMLHKKLRKGIFK